jgi:hypothetical protein
MDVDKASPRPQIACKPEVADCCLPSRLKSGDQGRVIAPYVQLEITRFTGSRTFAGYPNARRLQPLPQFVGDPQGEQSGAPEFL